VRRLIDGNPAGMLLKLKVAALKKKTRTNILILFTIYSWYSHIDLLS